MGRFGSLRDDQTSALGRLLPQAPTHGELVGRSVVKGARRRRRPAHNLGEAGRLAPLELHAVLFDHMRHVSASRLRRQIDDGLVID